MPKNNSLILVVPWNPEESEFRNFDEEINFACSSVTLYWDVSIPETTCVSLYIYCVTYAVDIKTHGTSI